MSTPVKFFGVLLGVPALILGVLYINTYVYPFQSKQPNFADVEEAFAKLHFPADWKEVDSRENRGIAGRGCDPFDASGCFHKSKTFKIPVNLTEQDIKGFFIQSGCQNVSLEDSTQKGEAKKTYNLRCSVGTAGVYLTGTYRGPEGEAYISVGTY